MSGELTFSDTDFFYNNVNAPIKFDPSLCSLSHAELTKKITEALNIPADIVSGNVPETDQTSGQCTFRRATAADANIDPRFKAQSWKLEYVQGSAGQQCNCVKVRPVEYVPYDTYTLSTSTKLIGSRIKPNSNTNYICKDSLPITITDTEINDISLDPNNRKQIITATVNYYKSACKNKDKSEILMSKPPTNEDSEVRYEDTKEFYNREYLNRINLGIGIIATCGFIYHTFTTVG
jgi:hypothetical protein